MDEKTVAVQGTGDDAAVSKLSAATLGYLNDPYMKFFVKKHSRRSPLINRGYYARVAAVEALLHEFMTTGDGPKQIVSLGAGFDTSFFRLQRDGLAPFKYIEIDYFTTLQRKAILIAKHEELMKAIGSARQFKDPAEYIKSADEIDLGSDCFHLVPADLRNTGELTDKLKAVGVDFSLPTFFLSECVLVYLRPDDSARVIEWASSHFETGVFATYEQIHPDDPFGRTMVANLQSRGCDLHGLAVHPDLPSQQARFNKLGWPRSVAWDMNDVYRYYIPREDVRRVERLELFDELEEWHLIQGQYCTALSSREPAADEDKLRYKTFGFFGCPRARPAAEAAQHKKLQAILATKQSTM